MAKPEKIDITSIATVIAFVTAFIGDMGFLFILPHYLCGIIVLATFWHKTKGWLAKLALIVAFILPLPLLTIGVGLAILLSNKFIAILSEQVVIQAVALGTAGVGELAEGAAIGEAAVDATEVGVEAAEGAAAAVEAGAGAGEAASAAGEAAEAGGEAAAEGIEPEALGEAPEPMEELEGKLLEESPEEQMKQKEAEEEGPEAEEEEERETDSQRKLREQWEKAKKIRDQMEKLKPAQQEEEENEEEGQGDIGQAA